MENLLQREIDVLGFSCYVWNINLVLQIAQRIKAQKPQIQIILGGPEVSPIAEPILSENPCIDFIVRQEGELTFVKLLDALKNKGSLNKVLGISYRQNGKVISNPDQPLLEDLSQIPSPFLDSRLDFSKNKYLCLETSRGCPRRCRFCQWSYKTLRYFPLERVLKEIEYLRGLPNLAHVYVADSSIFYKKERAHAILEAFAHKDRKHSIYFETDAGYIDDKMIESMSKLQKVTYAFGLQTVNPKVAKIMGRRLDLIKLRTVTELLKKSSTDNISIDLIYGLPGDTLDSYKDTLNYAMSLFPDRFTLYPFILLVGSEFYQRREEFGLKYDCHAPRWVYASDTFPKEDREKARKLSYYIQFFYIVPVIRQFMDALWLSLNKQSEVGHVELYERLIKEVEGRIDLLGVWEDVGVRGI